MPRTKRRHGRSGESRLRVYFQGAACSVTGSLHFFEYTDEEGKVVRFFVDAGLHQEDESLNYQNRLPAGMKPNDVQFGIFTHAHNDHTGFLPKLHKDGFSGPVYSTPPTAELLSILLPDSGFLQEEEARQRAAREMRRQERHAAEAAARATGQSGRKKHRQASRPRTRNVQPALYTQAEAIQSLRLLKTVPFDTRFKPHQDIVVEFKRASHLLGAAVVVLEIGNGHKKRRIVMSGDIGRPNMPILKNLVRLKRADYIFCEGTYGSRLHPRRDRQEALCELINAGFDRATKAHPKFGHGVILIPAFAVGRVQSVLFDLNALMTRAKIPSIPVLVDSPMAIRATAVYRKHVEEYNQSAQHALLAGDPFSTPEYAELMEASQSKKLDDPPSRPIIVLSSSGMASGGRVVHHLKQRLPGPQNTIIFAGFQSEGTLGRQLLESNGGTVMIGGEEVRVRATIAHMEDYSGHADCDDSLTWLSAFSPAPRKLFLVHGDVPNLQALKERVESKLKWDVMVPRLREYVDLD